MQLKYMIWPRTTVKVKRDLKETLVIEETIKRKHYLYVRKESYHNTLRADL